MPLAWLAQSCSRAACRPELVRRRRRPLEAFGMWLGHRDPDTHAALAAVGTRSALASPVRGGV